MNSAFQAFHHARQEARFNDADMFTHNNKSYYRTIHPNGFITYSGDTYRGGRKSKKTKKSRKTKKTLMKYRF